MANTKISALTSGAPAQATDEFVIARGGANNKLTMANLATYVGANGAAGTSLQLQYNAAGAFGGMSGTSWDDTNRALTLTGATVTTSNPVLNLSQEWGASGVTFTGLRFNAAGASNANSAAGSLLLDLQVGGASRLNVSKRGAVTVSPDNTGGGFLSNSGRGLRFDFGVPQLYSDYVGVQIGFSTAAIGLQFGVGGTYDATIARDAANTLALRNSTAAQSFRVYNSWTDASNNEYGTFDWSTSANVLTIGTLKNGTGTARNVSVVSAGGVITLANQTVVSGPLSCTSFQASSNATVQGVLLLNAAADVSFVRRGAGILTIGNASTPTDFDRLQFGGATSSFPALKRSSATLICRLADDSANAAFEALSLKTATPTGGTSGTWKVGVYNATAPSATGYVEVDIGGTLYKLLAAT